MAELVPDIALWAVLATASAIGAVVSRLLGRPWPVIIVDVAGALALLIGLRWASAIGGDALFAAAVASGGVVLWDIAARMHERHRKRPASRDSATAVG